MTTYDKIQKISIELQGQLQKEGKGFKHKYFTTEDIIPPILTHCEAEGIGFKTVYQADMVKLDIFDKKNRDDHEVYTLPIFWGTDNNSTEKNIQNVGKLQTYYKRYLLIQAFNICESDEIELFNPEQNKKKVPKRSERIPTTKTKIELSKLYLDIQEQCKGKDPTCIESKIWAYHDARLITDGDRDKLLQMYITNYKGGANM